jgi:hypothetical protein
MDLSEIKNSVDFTITHYKDFLRHANFAPRPMLEAAKVDLECTIDLLRR